MALGLGLVNSKSDYTDLTSPFIQGAAGRQPDIALIDAINSQEKTNDLIFDGTDDVLAIDGADITVSGAFTFVIVFKPDTDQTSTLLSGEPANSYLALAPQAIVGNLNMSFMANGHPTTFGHVKPFVPAVGDPELQYYIIQRAGNGNMTSESSVWGTANTINGQGNTEDFTINKVGGSVVGYYDGQIKEIFLFESIAQNSNDYRQINKYLEHKFGIEQYS